MKLPGEDTVRLIAAAVLILLVAGFVGYVNYLRHKGEKFDNVVSKLETTEESAEISRGAGEAASQSNQEHQYEVFEDRRAVAAARRAGPDDAAHDRLQQRLDEAYARGRCAESRLQRKDCGAELPPAPDD